MRLLASATLLLFTTGCAIGDRGWSGSGAVAFDRAQHDCTVDTATMADASLRAQAFDRCMNDKGWSRTR